MTAFTERDGRRLHWNATGDGPAVVLLPGLGSGMRLFGTLPRRFARHGLRALTYDPIGVAPSDPLEGAFSLEDAAADVFAVADAAGVEQLDLVGTSLGGKVAIVAAAQRPDRVRRLVLLAASAVPSARARRVYSFFEAVARDVAPERFADAVAPFLFGRSFLSARPALVDDIVRAMRPDEALRALMVAQARALIDFDGCAALDAVAADCLCVAGAEDSLTDVIDVQRSAERLQRARFAVIDGAGHSLLLESAEVFELARAFLQA